MSPSGLQAGYLQQDHSDASPDNSQATTEVIRGRGSHPSDDDLPLEKLAEALAVLQRHRWRQGERVLVEELLRDHPILRDTSEAFTLIYGEYLLREAAGEQPSLTDFYERFPSHAARLDRQVEVHRMLDGPCDDSKVEARTQSPQTQTQQNSGQSSSPSNVWPEVAGYEILGELGRGGMGVVYRARQLGLNRIVALKMVLGGPFADPQFQARFKVEAEVIARMQHPNIVQVFAVGTQESQLGAEFNCPYFSLEFVEGGSLEQSLGAKPQPAQDAARLVETLARAVHYAHEHGIVHRDLKSANILLTSAGVPKISDFGLAKQLNGPAGQTIHGSIVGTPEYMAPEQASGNQTIGPPADIYALGVILYELVTGRRPFQGATLDVLAQVLDQEPMPLSLLQSRTPRDLETICLKCLRKEPHQRYATALALAEDLRRFQQSEPIQARPVTATERLWRWAVRRPAVASLAALAILLAVGGALGITIAWLHALAGWSEADHLRVDAVIKQDEANHRREQVEANLYFSRIAEAHLERRSDNMHSAEALLDASIPRDGELDRRGWEWYYLKGLQHADLLTIPAAHEEFVSDLAISPDGQLVVTAGGTPFVPANQSDGIKVWALWGPNAGKCLAEFPQSCMVSRLAFRKDGQSIAWTGLRGEIGMANLATGKTEKLRTLPTGFKTAYMSPDALHYAAFSSAGELRVWELDGDRELLRLPYPWDTSTPGLAFDHSGKRLAIVTRTAIDIWDIASKNRIQALTPAKDLRSRPVFSTNGRLLACGTNSGLVRIWDIEKGLMIQSLGGHAGSVLAVAFAPGNQFLASSGADQTVRIWDVAEGVELTRLRGHQGRGSALSFHLSGRFLASGSEQPGEVKLWDLTRQQEYITVSPSARAFKSIEGLGFDQDGELLTVARNNGSLQVVRAETGVEKTVVKIDFGEKWRTPAALTAFSADGRRLACPSKTNPRIVTILDAATGQIIQHLPHNAEVLHVAFSRDGRRLVTSAHDFREPKSQREIRVWDTTTGELIKNIACPHYFTNHIYGSVALSADGELIAFDEYDPSGPLKNGAKVSVRVHIMDLKSGRTIKTLEGLSSLVRSLGFSPDTRFLAVGCEVGGVFVFDCQKNNWEPNQPLMGSAFYGWMDLSYSPDGRRLAAVSHLQIQLWDSVTGNPVLALRGAPPRPKDVGFNPRIAWSPDGRRLASSNWDGAASIWDSADRHTPDAKRALVLAAEERSRKP